MKRPTVNARLAELRLAAHERRQRRVDQLAPREGERGQILILFALVIIVVMLFASIAIDLGVLRNNRQILVNAVDSAALAGGTQMPIDACNNSQSASAACSSVNNAAVTALTTLITNTLVADYPGIQGSDYTISYRCIIGIDSSGNPYISRDIPTVCNPRGALGHNALNSDFQGSGDTRFSNCRPDLGDKCNTVYITASATTNYSFGRVVGVNNGNTGAVNSAACNGPCGNPPEIPVDLVIMIDRTGSMSSADLTNARNAAKTVLGIYNPALQRVAVGFLGPSELNTTCTGTGGPAVHANGLSLGGSATPPTTGTGAAWVGTSTGTTGGATSIVINKPTGLAAGNLMVAAITTSGTAGEALTAPAGWTLIRATANPNVLTLHSYYKIATAADASGAVTSFTWQLAPTIRAAGSIIRYTGTDPTTPIDVSSTANSAAATSTSVVANAVTTTTAQDAVLGLFATTAFTTFTPPAAMTEEADVANGTAGTPGPTLEGATVTQAAAGSSGTKTATAALTGRWGAQLVAIKPVPADIYGVAYPADVSRWIPIGFTGTDSDTPTLPGSVLNGHNEAYSDGAGTITNNTSIVSAINCFDTSGTGTNLASPMYMAYKYLQQYGRPNVKWGIILETDGSPNYNGSSGDQPNYTCGQANTNATAAKAITNAAGQPIEIFTIGFGIGAGDTCPDGTGAYPSSVFNGKSVTTALAAMATNSVDNGCVAAENTDGDNFFCEPKSNDLTTVFSVVATQLAGIRVHLVQLYPAPLVYSVTPTNGTRLGGTSVIINGVNFTSTSSVKFGATNAASYHVDSDTQITAVSPAGGAGQIVDIVVTNGGGSSPKNSADRYTFN